MKVKFIDSNKDYGSFFKVDVNYPETMINDKVGLVVMFHADKKGMVISGNHTYPEGTYSNTWMMDGFRPLKAGEYVLITK